MSAERADNVPAVGYGSWAEWRERAERLGPGNRPYEVLGATEDEEEAWADLLISQADLPSQRRVRSVARALHVLRDRPDVLARVEPPL